MKLHIDIEYIKFLDQERRNINSRQLGQIDFYEKNKKIKISKKLLKEFTGLSNIDFILTNAYKGIK
ncbi:MAG: hypothetical protein PHP92_03825 [Candidatus Nanoarchaeia archaeon]|nr:hypothetical protein [Candidatus Nanoarchaeia archaeon]